MKKIFISILTIFLALIILFYSSTFTFASSSNAITPLHTTLEDQTLISFDFETQETDTYHLPTSVLENPDGTPLLPYIPENMISTHHVFGGSDERERVDDTSSLPYSCIGYLDLTYNDSSSCATAFLVSKNIAITAGHAVFSEDSGFVKSITFTPGQRGFSHKPFGSTQVKRTIVPSQWSQNYNHDYDWAILVLNTDIGTQSGWMGIGTYPDYNSCKDLYCTISGYPGQAIGMDSEYPTTPGFQYCASGNIKKASEYILEYNIDVTKGQSGSPIFNTANMAFGISTWEELFHNEGCRVTLFFLETIRDAVVANN